MNHNAIPPFAYRLMCKAIVGHIVFRSKLSRRTVQRISKLKSWDTVPYGRLRRFIIGCGFDPDRPPIKLWQHVCESGLASVKHLQPSRSDKLWQVGAKASRVKAVRNVVAA